MKSLAPWFCLLVASASQPIFADEFSAYRLGNYNKAIEPLINKTGKDAIADYYLGRIYLYGYGQLKNTQLAMRYFTQSAQKGYLPAIQLLAKYSLFQEKDPTKAVSWFKQAAAAGDANAQMFMAAAYIYGVGVKKNKSMATRYYIDAAKSGNPIAQYTLAEDFIESRHSANNKLGLIWLNKAVANNNLDALTKLASLYLKGKLVPKDAQKGKELLEQAAGKNFAPAMIQLGKLALEQNQKEQAIQWFNKAGENQNDNVDLELAQIYATEKGALYDPKEAFRWTLKAAQNGSVVAQKQLATFYQKGIGVEADAALAKQWSERAKEDEKNTNSKKALAEAALWLSNGSTDKLEQTAYQMNGIFSAWHNTTVLGNYAYNQAPQLQMLSRHTIFKPQFDLVQPNEISISTYYDALLKQKNDNQNNQWMYPLYPLNKQVANLEKENSPVLMHFGLPAPHTDAHYVDVETEVSVLDHWLEGWKKQANYLAVFHPLYSRAILGDAQAQFEIGQMFQYGISVPQNRDAAIIFYQNAVQQQHLGAEYNLGILYLQQAQDKNDYQLALNDLTDAAFKGNKKSQYVLARLLEKGVMGPEGVEYIKADPEQANSMLYLAAANDYGIAEYELANRLARQQEHGLDVETKRKKIALIRELYQGAVDKGVSNALLPLAFYNAMDGNREKHTQAFAVAKEQALGGDSSAALLMGLLYDRGIGTHMDATEAMNWYKKAGANAVSQFILGTYTAEGQGLEKNREKGMALLQKAGNDKFSYADFNIAVLQQKSGQDFLPDLTHAYELGNSHAGIVLADYYLSAKADPEKMKQAREIYQGLAEKGDRNAQLKLAFMDEKGIGASIDLSRALQWYTASAEQGNPTAQYLLAQFYQKGANGQPDYQLAKQWYEKASTHLPEALVALGFIAETVDDNYHEALSDYTKAAVKGNTLGTYNLALMYLYGKGTPVDYQKAKTLFTEAADHQVSEAMNQLGNIYFNGWGQARDQQLALSWYTKAAELGNANALYELGLFSETGINSAIDFNTALKYYQAAANKNNEKAMLALARMYHYGLGVEKNPKLAAPIYQKLASRQNAYAQYQLGTYYLEGTAGELSPSKGKELLLQASENGNAQARKALQRIEAQSQARVSFIEPVVLSRAPSVAGEAVNLYYLHALNEWNGGNELTSKRMLQYLITQHPDFAPAKSAYEQLCQSQLLSSQKS